MRKINRTVLIIKCACGCNSELTNIDKYGRTRKYISGHNGKKYEDKTQYKREWNHRNRKSRMIYKTNYYRQRKAQLVIYKGGVCQDCKIEYNGKNAAIFQFDHRDRSQKLFNFNTLVNKSLETIHQEVDKCDLVCANCHFLRTAKAEY